MVDDPILLLERELVDAARRRTAPPPVRRGRPHRLTGRGPASLVVPGVAVAVALAVAVVALVSLNGGHGATQPRPRPRQPATSAAAVRAERQLTRVLAVLRRPQTALDRKILAQSGLGTGAQGFLGGGRVDAGSARLATITPWGSRVLVAVVIPAAPGARKRWGAAGFEPMAQAGLITWADHGGGCCATARSIETTGSWSSSGAGRSFAGGSPATRYYVVVPDGVARVAFVSRPQSIQAGGPTYRRTLTVTAPVHGNVAAAEIHRQLNGGPLMVWYAADGRVIRRVGNFAAAAHPRRPPQPGPQTALSRRALRDPSTPNRVWATPAVGGPRSSFAIRFRQLINDADYTYRFVSTPRGSGCGVGTSTSDPDGGPTDIRGPIFTFTYAAPRSGWCPGTYRFSVALMDLGRAGAIHGPVWPFGVASFTVRP